MPANTPAVVQALNNTWTPRIEKKASQKCRLLVVDKPQFSAMIQKMLEQHYDVVCVDDAASGLKQLAQATFEGVIVDEQVVGGGLQLVECMKMNPVWRHLPVILTCINPTEAWVRHIKLNDIACLIAKPFRPSTLLAQLKVMSLETVSVHKAPDDIDVLVSTIDENLKIFKRLLPHSPEFGVSVSNEGLFDLLAQDKVVQSVVLALANSAYSPAWRKIDSAKLAVNMMGVPEATRAVECLKYVRSLQHYAPNSRFNLASLNKHAIGTAAIARALGKKVALDEERCFWAGLMHDAGKVILDRAFVSGYAAVRDAVFKGRIPFVCAEEEILGFSHSLAGGYLARHWQMGDDITEALVCHHDLLFARRHTKLTSVLYVADLICSFLEFGSTGELTKPTQADPLLAKAFWKLGLPPRSFDVLVEMGKAELKYAQNLVDAISHGEQ